MITTVGQAFDILEHATDGVPFDAIEFLYSHPPEDIITDRIIFHLNNAYNEDLYREPDSEYLLSTSLWFAIVAENHLHPRLIEPVINLFLKSDQSWDFLNEQGQFLVGKLCEAFPEIAIPKMMMAIESIIETDTELPYHFLFDCLYFADPEIYKERILKVLAHDEFTWYESFAVTISDIGIREAIPEIRKKLESRKQKDPDEDQRIITGELEFALKQLESENIHIRDTAQPYCRTRAGWKDHYPSIGKYFSETGNPRAGSLFRNHSR
jgi:hypothetical protein